MQMNRRRGGFSLVEIMIALVIVGLLATVVTINVRSYLLNAKRKKATQDIAALQGALDTYFAECGSYPTAQEGLRVLREPSDTFPEPLIKNLPDDPWGHPYQYYSSGPRDCEVVCFGADGREGGSGADKDISSHDLEQ